MRLVFLGTAGFGVPALKSLNQKHEIELVISQPDRPGGRGLKKRVCPVKRTCLNLNLPLFQPEEINSGSAIRRIQKLDPKAMIVVAYGQILRSELLRSVEWPINIHASLLPQYRGPAPINWAIINGEDETGVTTILMDEGVDTGPILLQRSLSVGENETAGELHDRLSLLGSKVILETLDRLRKGNLTPRPQPQEGSKAPKLSSRDSSIDWSRSSSRVHNLVRGMSPWPGAFTYFRGNRVKILRTEDTGVENSEEELYPPGTIIDLRRDCLVVGCGSQTRLRVLKVQPASRKKMTGREFANGYRVNIGDNFGAVS